MRDREKNSNQAKGRNCNGATRLLKKRESWKISGKRDKGLRKRGGKFLPFWGGKGEKEKKRKVPCQERCGIKQGKSLLLKGNDCADNFARGGKKEREKEREVVSP